MEKRELEIGDVVQITPDKESQFRAALMIVTEPKPWGAQGVVTAPKMEEGVAYYRCKFEDMEYVGKASWHVVGFCDDEEAKP